MTKADQLAASGQTNVGVHTEAHSLPSKAGVHAPANTPKIEPRRSRIVEWIQPLGSQKAYSNSTLVKLGDRPN
jgi:hypothetical protein